MNSSPHIIDVMLGLFGASLVAILTMYVGGQFFDWDITHDKPVWLGLFVYFAYGGLMAAIVSICALLLWVILCWKKSSIGWWIPPVLGSILIGGLMGIAVNMAYFIFGLVTGFCAGLTFWLISVGRKNRVFLMFKN
ncbi:putative membrane protein [Sulfitobacter undariae]|uniref:Putative membrane protein n=1 Tax=Sulfitobacter undariae TaxID=1563671 RepID=A0A7W6E0J4_9RHOB|nr:putative membrane protein [Sulfitobacter undariae]